MMRNWIYALAMLISLASAPAPVLADDHGQATESIGQGPAPLAQFLAEHPARVAVVMVSTPGCPFCQIVRERQLEPMLRDPAFSQVGVFEIMMRDNRAFTPAINTFKRYDGSTFTGLASPQALSRAMNIQLAPTLLFIAGHRELAEPLIGYAGGDFYSAYLEERINQAREQIQSGDERN